LERKSLRSVLADRAPSYTLCASILKTRKAYGPWARRIARAVVDGVHGMLEVQSFLFRRRGTPIDAPPGFHPKVSLADAAALAGVPSRIEAIAKESSPGSTGSERTT